MTDLWLGVDVGTTAIKAAAYDSHGRIAAVAERSNEVLRPAPGHAEQDMLAVWERVAACLRELAGKCAGRRFLSLGLCGQGDGFWPIDAQGRPTHNAMLWNDTRAAADVDALIASGAADAIGHGCHTSLWAGTAAPLWRWLRATAPEAAARTAHVVTCADWVGLCLTGALATDRSNGTIPFTDFATGAYGAAIAALDCADLAPRLVAPRSATELLGAVSAEAAKATGLPEGLPVSVATLDLAAMIVGMGLDRAGQAMMIMGTTAVVNILTDKVTLQALPVGASVRHPTSDTIIRVLAPTTGAAAFDWFASLVSPAAGAVDREAIAELGALVASGRPGANGVTFLPYLNGERAPFVMADLRATFHGMSSSTTRADLARAVMEGTALSLRHCCEEEGGLTAAPVQLTGGGSRSEAWCQIIADVVGQPVVTNAAFDQGLWGAACLGAAATGLGDPVALAAREETQRLYEPDAARARAYDAVWRRYEILSRGMRALHDELKAP